MRNKIAKELIESFGYEQKLDEFSASDMWDVSRAIAGSDEVKSMAKTAGAGAIAGKVASKALGRAIPGVGTALSWKNAYDRWLAGDRSGAVLSALAGAAYLAPGVGTAVGLGLDAANIGRDLAKDDDEETAANPETPVNKLAQLQQIIGANPDGIYGPETKQKLMIWQKEQGIKVDGMPGPETYKKAGIAESRGKIMKKTTTIAEDIAALRDKLLIIENDEIIDEMGLPPGVNPIKLTQEIWKLAKLGVTDKTAILQSLEKTFGKNLPADINKMIDNAVSTSTKSAGAGAAGAGTAGAGKSISAFGPEEIDKLSKSALYSPKITPSEKEAIKKMGIVNWMKQNPKKAALISGMAGLGIGYGIGSLSHGDNPQIPPGPPTPGPHGKRGDPDIMKQQEILNALTDSNLTIDGIWGPQTQAAYEKWKSGADAAEQDMKIRPATPSQAELDKTAQDSRAVATQKQQEAEKAKADYAAKYPQQSIAESIASLRDVLEAIERQ